MDENKIIGTSDVPENEEVIENNEEVIENSLEEPIEEAITEEFAEEDLEENETTQEEVSDAIEEGVFVDNIGEDPVEEIVYDKELLEEVPLKKSNKGVIALIGAIALIVILVLLLIVGVFGGNKYNKMGYEDISGMTLGEMCEQMGADIEEFKTTYELPADMPADTNFNAAYNMMPVKVIAALNFTDYATLKEDFQIPDMTTPSEPKGFFGKIKAIFVKEKAVEITEDTPWGVVQGEVILQYAVGEENLETFKEEYGFGPEITLETKWKEVRPAVEKAALKQRLEAEKAEEKYQELEAEKQEQEEQNDVQDEAADAAEPVEGTEENNTTAQE